MDPDPDQWDGSRELDEAPPEVTVFMVIILDPDPDPDLGTVDRSLPAVEWDGSRELAEAPPEVTGFFYNHSSSAVDPDPDPGGQK